MSNEPGAGPPPPSKARTFVRRLASTCVLWTVVLVALFSGNRTLSDSFFLLLLSALAWTGLTEFYGLAGKTGLISFKVWGVSCGLLPPRCT